MSETMSPCPFCGSVVDPIVYDDSWDSEHHWRVECCECGALGASRTTEEDARRAWNKREEPDN